MPAFRDWLVSQAGAVRMVAALVKTPLGAKGEDLAYQVDGRGLHDPRGSAHDAASREWSWQTP
jgi:hypothetical protein